MTQNTRLYMTVDNKDAAKIDKIVKQINADKPTWRRATNRQAVLRGLISFALEQDIKFISGSYKDVKVVFRKKKSVET